MREDGGVAELGGRFGCVAGESGRGMDIGVGKVLIRLPKKSCWVPGWLKTYLRRLTVIMIEELSVAERKLTEILDCYSLS